VPFGGVEAERDRIEARADPGDVADTRWRRIRSPASTTESGDEAMSQFGTSLGGQVAPQSGAPVAGHRSDQRRSEKSTAEGLVVGPETHRIGREQEGAGEDPGDRPAVVEGASRLSAPALSSATVHQPSGMKFSLRPATMRPPPGRGSTEVARPAPAGNGQTMSGSASPSAVNESTAKSPATPHGDPPRSGPPTPLALSSQIGEACGPLIAIVGGDAGAAPRPGQRPVQGSNAVIRISVPARPIAKRRAVGAQRQRLRRVRIRILAGPDDLSVRRRCAAAPPAADGLTLGIGGQKHPQVAFRFAVLEATSRDRLVPAPFEVPEERPGAVRGVGSAEEHRDDERELPR
jgi:hypothetical protein